MKKKITITAMSLLMALFLLPINGFAYTINNEFNLGPNEGSSQVANNQYILLHETANETATGRNEAQYMQRSWTSAYTAYIVGDGGIVYQVGQPGYVQYGAGSYANANSPVQIELQHTHDKATFEKNYKAYVELARDSAIKYSIPLTLDTPYNQPGIKSHLWVTQNIWGDHTDPYGYLSEMGVSKTKLANDLIHGFSSEMTIPQRHHLNQSLIQLEQVQQIQHSLMERIILTLISLGKSKMRTCTSLVGTSLTINTSIFSLWITILEKN